MKKFSTILLISVQQAYAAIVKDGPWTGHDWYDDTKQVGVKNGVPYSNDAGRQRQIVSPLSFDGSIPDNYMSRPNV